MRTEKLLKAVLVPLAVICVVIAVVLRLFGWAPWGFASGGFLKLANAILLIVIVILLLRIDKKSEIV